MGAKKRKAVELSGDTLYECGECGKRFFDEGYGHRCSDCNKFATRVSDNALACPHCEKPIDLEEWS